MNASREVPALLWHVAPLLCLGALALALDVGLGSESPGALFVAFCVSAWFLARWSYWRLGRGPVRPADALLSVACAGFLAYGFVLGALGTQIRPDLEFVSTRFALGAVLLALFCASFRGSLRLGRRLLALSVEANAPPSSEGPPGRWSAALVAAVTLAAHVGLFFGLEATPLLQIDSVANLGHPGFLTFTTPPHHPPIYPELIKTIGHPQGSYLPGLVLVVVFQHALVLGVALGFERAGRLLTGRPWVGCLTGLLIGLDATWNLYAQSVMSEILASSLCMFSALCLLEAERRRRAVKWLVAAGLLAALATLTRQAMQAWFGVGLIWLTLFSALRPKRLACFALCVASLLPVGGWMLRNYVILERPIVTASLGRNLLYRVVQDMPDLTDPEANPGDELERARRIVWREREHVWGGPWLALGDELGWSDAQINSAVVRFYFEQMRRHPGTFAFVTGRSFLQLAQCKEWITSMALPFHNRIATEGPWRLRTLPSHDAAPASVSFLDKFQLSSSLWWLLLASGAPLVTWGAARRASFLVLGGACYFWLLAAMVEVVIPRYRLPAVPLVYLAGCLTLAGVAHRLQEFKRRFGPGGAEEEARAPTEELPAAAEQDSSSPPAPEETRGADSEGAPGGPVQLSRAWSRFACGLVLAQGLMVAGAGVSFPLVLVALGAQAGVALLGVRLRGGLAPRFKRVDAQAWTSLTIGTTLVTLAAFPVPIWVSEVPLRGPLLALLALLNTLGAAVFFARPGEEPTEVGPATERGAGG